MFRTGFRKRRKRRKRIRWKRRKPRRQLSQTSTMCGRGAESASKSSNHAQSVWSLEPKDFIIQSLWSAQKVKEGYDESVTSVPFHLQNCCLCDHLNGKDKVWNYVVSEMCISSSTKTYVYQGFFLHRISKTQAQKNSKSRKFIKTQGLFYPKTQGLRHIYIVTMTSSGKFLVKNSRIFFKNSIFQHFKAQSMPHKCPKKTLP